MDDLVALYKPAWLKALVQLIPVAGGPIDVFLEARVEAIRKKRLTAFFDELSTGDVGLTQEVIDSDEFLHCYFRTLKAVTSTRRDEKIQLFARLLGSSFQSSGEEAIDEFEEHASILDNLSWREWRALAILHSFYVTPKLNGENGLQWTLKFWNSFKERLETELGIPEGEASDFMNAISRTGLYEQFVGGFMDYTGGVGRLTPKYGRLANLVERSGAGGADSSIGPA